MRVRKSTAVMAAIQACGFEQVELSGQHLENEISFFPKMSSYFTMYILNMCINCMPPSYNALEISSCILFFYLSLQNLPVVCCCCSNYCRNPTSPPFSVELTSLSSRMFFRLPHYMSIFLISVKTKILLWGKKKQKKKSFATSFYLYRSAPYRGYDSL